MSRVWTAALAALAAATLLAGGAGSASATATAGAPASASGDRKGTAKTAGNPGARILHIARSQRRILRRGAIRVRIRSGRRGRVRL